MPRNALHPATLAAQALGWTDAATGAVVLPIQPATTFLRDPDNRYRRGRSYGRADTPGRALPPGARVVAPLVMYWALRRWLGQSNATGALAVGFVDMTSLDALRAAMRPGQTRLVWIETPANPLWSVTDIAGAAEIAHEAG